jgi:hypothetical protein
LNAKTKEQLYDDLNGKNLFFVSKKEQLHVALADAETGIRFLEHHI